MAYSELLLSAAAFIVGFCFSLAIYRNFQMALFGGLIAIPAAFAGLIAVNIQRRIYQKRILTCLQIQIRQMEKIKTESEQYLYAIAEEYNRIEDQIDYRHNHLNQLYIQIMERQKSKQQLTLEIISIGEEKRRHEAELYHLGQEKEELDLSLRNLKAEHHEAETYLSTLQAELKILRSEKEHLEETMEFLRSQLHEWHTEDEETSNLNSPFDELLPAKPQKFLPASPENLDKEWTELIAQLNDGERDVLSAIAWQDRPNATIKKIAEAHVTMPEILIDKINERAIAIIGDIIIEPGTDAPKIVDSEYLEILQKLLKIPVAN
jgi:TerB-C domain